MTFTYVENDRSAKIKVIGVGGAGGNAVNNIIASNLQGVKFIAANTDAQALDISHAEHRIQLGERITQGLGAGANPQVGREAAIENADDIRNALADSHMVFITAGFGGGTGTGAAPAIDGLPGGGPGPGPGEILSQLQGHADDPIRRRRFGRGTGPGARHPRPPGGPQDGDAWL